MSKMWRKSRKRGQDATTQVYEENWYVAGFHNLHECCNCGLVHRVDFRFEDGRLYERWRRDEAETLKARRAMKKA